MPGMPLANRVSRHTVKQFTFDGSIVGVIGALPVFSIVGSVWLQFLAARCKATLTGATATIALGEAGNTGGLIAQTTATNITNGLIWNGASPATGNAAGVANHILNASVIATIATAAITGGILAFECYWLPLSPDGQLS